MTREKENLPPNAIFVTIETPKKPPRQKIFQEDQMKPLKKKLDVIKYLDDINKEKMKSLDAWIRNRSKKEHLLLYKLEYKEDCLPEVTAYCILVGDDLRVKLFYYNTYQLLCPSGLQREEIRSSFSIWFKIFLSHMKNRSEKQQEILTEDLNTTNAEVILLAQLAMLCYGPVHFCKHTSSCLKSCYCLPFPTWNN